MSRRIRVEGRDARLVVAIGLVSGVVAAVAGASPTGSTPVDVVLVICAVTGCVWAAASAPWWAGVVAAGAALAFAPNVGLIAIGLVPFMGGMSIGSTRRSLPWSCALAAGLAVQVFARLGNVAFFGFTALLAIVVLAALSVLGVLRRPRVERRRVWAALGGLALAFVLALAGLALAGSSARPALENGNRLARSGLDLLREGDVAGAREAFSQASKQFGNAGDDLGALWAQPARLVPVAAQHRRAASELVDGAADATKVLGQQLASIDYDQLKVVNGRIDLAAVAGLADPLARLDGALDDLSGTVADADDPWLLNAVSTRLDELSVDLAKAKVDLTNARAAVAQAPAMLGAEGPRVYFVAFTTPAEARGLGGFMGNWAEITLDQGKLSVTGFGRTADLGGGDTDKHLESPSDEFVRQYGAFLYSNERTRIAASEVWSNITISPDFPSVAQMIAELYPQSGGTTVDGVVAMDVYALAQLMTITGAVDLPDGTTVTPENAVQYLLTDQYLTGDNNERVDALETAALTSVNRLLTSTLPSPPELGKLFSPLARGGRLMAWASRPAEEDVLTRVNMANPVPDRSGGDFFGVAFNNGSANKIDTYLHAEATYDVTIDRAAGRVTGTATITLRNDAPSSGVPDYVIGNQVGLPTGTNRTQVTVYTGLPVTTLVVDDQPVAYTANSEGGQVASSTFVDIPPGGTVTVTVTVAGALIGDAEYRLVLRSPAIVSPLPITVSVNGASPTLEISESGVRRASFPALS